MQYQLMVYVLGWIVALKGHRPRRGKPSGYQANLALVIFCCPSKSRPPQAYAVVVQGTKNPLDLIFDMQAENQTPYPYVNGTNVAVGALSDLNQVFKHPGSPMFSTGKILSRHCPPT